jgi:hypothetical protein
MTDHRNNFPPTPDDDQALDRALASLGRLSPSAAFADRVMARVRIAALAAPAAPAAPWADPAGAWLVRRRRWPALVGALSGAAALSSTALTAWVALNWAAITGWATTTVATGAVVAWQAVLAWLATASESAGSTVLAAVLGVGPSSLLGAFITMNLAVPVSLYGLFLVARPRLRIASHAAR